MLHWKHDKNIQDKHSDTDFKIRKKKKNRREEEREYGGKEVLEKVTKTFQDLGDLQTKSKKKVPRVTLSPAFSLNGALALIITL